MYSTGSSLDRSEASSPHEAEDFPSLEHQSMISVSSYAEMREIIENFVSSKRRARDAENNYHFLKAGPKSSCARIDAVYSVRAGVTSHIKVQDKDQYWAEEERKFPHLKEIHLQEEMMNTDQSKSNASESQETNVSLPLDTSSHPFPTPDTSPERSEDGPLTHSTEMVALQKTKECQRLVPVVTRLKEGKPPLKKARLENNGNMITHLRLSQS